VRFEWDAAKARSNLAKHGVDFEEAATTFYDPLALQERDEEHSRAEERFRRLGRSQQGRLLVTIFTERGDAIRIISSRPATRREVKRYEEGV
jgi:uncharacterized DUF497 family protein